MLCCVSEHQLKLSAAVFSTLKLQNGKVISGSHHVDQLVEENRIQAVRELPRNMHVHGCHIGNDWCFNFLLVKKPTSISQIFLFVTFRCELNGTLLNTLWKQSERNNGLDGFDREFPSSIILIVFKTPKTGLFGNGAPLVQRTLSDVVYTCLYPYRYSPLYCINIAMCPDSGQNVHPVSTFLK